MAYWYNAAGYRGELPERSLEPPDCWIEEPAEPDDEEYDRAECDASGGFNRT